MGVTSACPSFRTTAIFPVRVPASTNSRHSSLVMSRMPAG